MSMVDCENTTTSQNSELDRIKAVCCERLAGSSVAPYSSWVVKILTHKAPGASFLRGFASLPSSCRVRHFAVTHADEDHGIAGDWDIVGRDLLSAIVKFHSTEWECGR